MTKMKKLGKTPVFTPNYGPMPQDPTRTPVTMNSPQDQSIYSNPITSNQSMRTPSSLQTGSLPNMQMSQGMGGLNSVVSPNSLPVSTPPQSPAPQDLNPNE